MKQPTMLGEGSWLSPSYQLSFPTGGVGGSGETSLCGALGEGECSHYVASSLMLLMQSVWVFMVQEVLEPHSNVLGVPHWCLVLE